MRMFEPTMIDQIDIFIERIHRAASDSTAINMSVIVRHLGLDIAGLLGFGYNLGMQTSEKNRFMLPMLDTGATWSSVFLHWPGSRRVRIGLVAHKIFRSLRGKYLSLVHKMISSRSSMGTDAKKDLYSILAPALGDGSEGLRQSELWAEANMFLPAGM